MPLPVAPWATASAPGLPGDFDEMLGDQRPGDRGAEQIEPLIQRVGAEHREHEIAHEFLAHVADVDLLDAEQLGLLARRLQLVALTEIGGEGDDFGAEFGLQPFEDDRGVEPARIGEHDLLHVFPLVHRFPRGFSAGLLAGRRASASSRFRLRRDASKARSARAPRARRTRSASKARPARRRRSSDRRTPRAARRRAAQIAQIANAALPRCRCGHSGMRQMSQKIDDASPDTNEQLPGQAFDHSPAGTNGSKPPNRSVETGRGRPQYSLRKTFTIRPGPTSKADDRGDAEANASVGETPRPAARSRASIATTTMADDDRQIVEESRGSPPAQRWRRLGKLPQATACDPCAQGCAAKNIDEIRWSISGSPLNTSASAIHSANSASSRTGSAHRPNMGVGARIAANAVLRRCSSRDLISQSLNDMRLHGIRAAGKTRQRQGRFASCRRSDMRAA